MLVNDLYDLPIHEKVLNQLIAEGIIVLYKERGDNMSARYGLKPDYRRLLLNKMPIAPSRITKTKIAKPIKFKN